MVALARRCPKKPQTNTRVVWSDTSSTHEHTNCDPFVRCQIEVTIKEKMLENTLNDRVDHGNMEDPHFFPSIEGMEFGYEREDSGPAIDEGMPNMEATMDPFQ
jgi:hypothetical protein